MKTVITRRPKGEAAPVLMVAQGLTLVDRYRYDGLYVVDKVSGIPALRCHFLIFLHRPR